MARDNHYERARKTAHSLPVVDFGSHEAIEAVAAVFRADAAELDALRAVAEAARKLPEPRGDRDAGSAFELDWQTFVSDQVLGEVHAALDKVREAERA